MDRIPPPQWLRQQPIRIHFTGLYGEGVNENTPIILVSNPEIPKTSYPVDEGLLGSLPKVDPMPFFNHETGEDL
jgi:hypothetical protein